jgi:phospholipid/cholesterol/gamma-HCH transport system ATP-binding protein
MSEALIRVENVSFAHNDRVIFDNISLNIEQGKITAIMGPSGTGKTTLLRLLTGQLKPSSGHVYFGEQCINTLSRKELYKTRRKMGMLFQNGALFTHLTVFENVAFPLREHTQLSELMIRDVVLLKLEAVGLRGARDLYPNELSGGMARRVALARAIALDPMLILYDEPFTGQDPILMGVLVKLIKELNDILQLTSIIVSHDVPETASIADYIYVLAGGNVVGAGDPQNLVADDNPHVRQFMHGLADGVVPFHYPAPDFMADLLSSKGE